MINNIRILLIEDNDIDQLLLSSTIEKSNINAEISKANSLKEGFDIIEAATKKNKENNSYGKAFDVVLLDLGLPDSEGLDTIKRFVAFTTKFPILVLSGRSDTELARMAIKYGVQDYIEKDRVDAYNLEKSILFTIERHFIHSELNQAQKDLKRLNDSLEEKVELRTKELNDSKESLEQALTIRSRFLDNITHEIRTPLTSIKGALHIIKSKTMPRELEPLIDMIESESNRIQHFFENILDMTLFQNDGIKLNLGVCRLDDISRKLIQYAQDQLKRSNIHLRTEISDFSDQSYEGDTHYIYKMLRYLVENAVQYTEEGQISMSFKPLSYNGYVMDFEFEISNTGDALTETQRKLMFESFIQCEEKVNKFRGPGLGLNLSKKIAELMNGDISYRYDANIGNIFTCNFRLMKISSEAAA